MVRFEPQEQPPPLLSLGLGLQQAALCVAAIILTPVIVIRAADGGDPYLTWAVFGAVLVSGLSTVLQSLRLGRIGAGYPMVMGTSGAFIAVSVTALSTGGPGMLATLVVISALFQFLLAARLSWLRRLITPMVAGTVIMLIAVTLMPIVFDMLKDVPETASPAAAPASAALTLCVIAGLALCGANSLRLWVPLIGLIAGCIASLHFGIYDVDRVVQAGWFGLPAVGWPGFDLDFGPVFWGLLPAFVFVTLVGAIETIGDATAIQLVSWRQPRATDFREVQGAVAADGVGNLLSGIAGTVPNTTYSSSIAVVELTGVAARRVGVVVGAVFVAVAFVPKAAALLLAVPGPVAAAYLLVLMAMLFVVGMRMIVQDRVDYRKAVAVGLSFWLGVGFQNQLIFADQLGAWWGTLLGNGMTAGGVAAILLNLVLQTAKGRRRRIETALDLSATGEIGAFLGNCASRQGWDGDAVHRLRSAAEEALQSLIDLQERAASDGAGKPRRLLLIAQGDSRDMELEFVAAPSGENLENLVVLIPNLPEEFPAEREISLRLLRHYAAAVHHQQYHDTDILTVRVNRDPA